MDLVHLHDIAGERSARWTKLGVRSEVIDGRPTDKPAAWIVLTTPSDVGQVILWASGESEFEWGTPERGGNRHCEIHSREELEACIDDLEFVLGLT